MNRATRIAVSLSGLFLITFFCTGLPEESRAAGDQTETMEQKDMETEDKIQPTSKAEVVSGEQVDRLLAIIQEDLAVKIGGALRFNYALRDFDDDSKARGGDMEFDIFRIDFNGSYKDVLISAQYRWYSYQDVIHHGWIGYDFTDAWQAQIGVTQVPFGILPYASHNWWFGVPYYLGFEDDYDLGIKTIYNRDPWNLQLAFFKNAEWGDPSKLERYSFDVVTQGDQQNEETNQVNLRLAYTFTHGKDSRTEIGVSGEWGQLYNSDEESSGDHWAAAAHLNANLGRWNLMLEGARYEFNPDNPQGVDDDQVLIGAFATASLTAAKGTIAVANIAYSLPVKWGPISNLTFYNDYSILIKDKNGFDNSQINTLGCLITAGPVFTYVDLIFGRNALFLGAGTEPYGAASDSDDDWHTRFNINVGYYF